MKDTEDLRTGTTRRRFLLGTPLGVSALSAYAMSRATEAEGAPNEGRDLPELTATEAVALLRSGDLSAEKYAQALLDQCRKHRALNAFIWQNEDPALTNATSFLQARRVQTVRSMLDYLPTRWIASFSFSKQIESSSSVLRTMYSMTLTVHGLV